jgi:Tfp pilus assembly pilus retraction ATPase PilT
VRRQLLGQPPLLDYQGKTEVPLAAATLIAVPTTWATRATRVRAMSGLPGDHNYMTAVITDIHVHTKDVQGDVVADIATSLIYPGPKAASETHRSLIEALCRKCLAVGRSDFMIEEGGHFYRGRRDTRAVDGLWFRLRRMADVAPNLDELPTPMAAILKNTLLAEQLTKGGLIFVTGGPGCGKTTTASAILVSRLHQYGGVAYTVEDPPEMPLNGRHGPGYCTQTWVAGDDSADWAESMRGVLRSQPVGTNLMLYVGEVRDAETGRAMLRAASNGFLVVSTGFGNDIVSGIDAFFQLCGREYAMSVASVLRVVLYQKIIDGKFNAQMLVSESASSAVAAIIRNGQIAQLQNEVNYQKNRQISGEAFFQLPKARAA